MIIRLNNKFYNKEIVKGALKNFKEVCEGRILNDDMDVELETKDDAPKLKEEFCNHVLGLMKNKTLV